MTLRREHLPLELERRLVAVQLVASLRETDSNFFSLIFIVFGPDGTSSSLM